VDKWGGKWGKEKKRKISVRILVAVIIMTQAIVSTARPEGEEIDKGRRMDVTESAFFDM
jgi:hypothetical protein